MRFLLELPSPEPESWTDQQTDILLDVFCQGAHPRRIATILQRTPKAIVRRLQALFYNERSQAEEYRPRHRWDRKGKRLNQNEKQIILCHAERGIPVELTSKLLTRTIQEIEQFKTRHAIANSHTPSLPESMGSSHC